MADTSPVHAALDFAYSVTIEIETPRTKCTYFCI